MRAFRLPTRTTAGAAVAAWLLVVAPAHAGAEHVVVVAEDTGSALVRTLVSELSAGGYAVDVLSAAAGIDLSSEAGARHARGVLRVSPSADSVDLWLADREGAPVRFRERIEEASGGDDPSVLAIRAFEALHGKLLPVAPAAPADPPIMPERPAPAPAPPPSPARFATSIGPGVVTSPGGASVGAEAALGFSWLATERITVDALARVPVAPAHVDGAEGTAHVALAAVGGGLSFAFAGRDALVRPSAGAGLALGWTHVDGVANAPFVSHSADLFAALPYVSLATRVRLTPGLALRADVLGAVSLPSQAITFAGRQVATFGEPVLDGALSLEAVWR